MAYPRFSKVPSGCRVENTHGECACVLRCVQLFASPWTVASQAPPSTESSRQKYWIGLPFPSPGDLPDPGIEPGSPSLQPDSLPSEPHPRAEMFLSPFKNLYT